MYSAAHTHTHKSGQNQAKNIEAKLGAEQKHVIGTFVLSEWFTKSLNPNQKCSSNGKSATAQKERTVESAGNDGSKINYVSPKARPKWNIAWNFLMIWTRTSARKFMWTHAVMHPHKSLRYLSVLRILAMLFRAEMGEKLCQTKFCALNSHPHTTHGAGREREW